jgi:hypothetical protein
MTREKLKTFPLLVARILIGAGIDVNSPSYKLRRTPLHTAVFEENQCMIKILISCGASLSAVDAKGRSPLDIADEYKNVIPRTFLLLWMAERREKYRMDKAARRKSCCLCCIL